ncbi:Uu.00g031390.m01.CDS01 [Anthostomella pinea]|uniref:Lysine--tRNA ligase n=1 Tax=Anthostomella pinea TaxID=933095 RepID=A0AAI8V8H5_9PEZI|nr:Uu.00g031390.m01.CDS01 [Anthostomella pinea]
MSSKQCLRFLRPSLRDPRPAKKAAFTRFSSAAYHNLVRTNWPCVSSRGIAPRNRSLSTSASRTSSDGQAGAAQDGLKTSARRPSTVENRVQKLREYNALRYPRLDDRVNRMSIPAFRKTYQDHQGSTPAPDEVTLEGRIMSVRRAGSKLAFVDVKGGYEQVQIMIGLASLSSSELGSHEFKEALHPFRRGDIISAKGKAVRTQMGELSLRATEIPKLLSPGLAPLPEKLINEETIIMNRHVDLLINQRTSDVLRLRSHIIKSLRDYFHEQDFLEVQTPIMSDFAGGATARPFLTSATEFPEKSLALRIAPELWLKRLVVGGNDKVFEIGPAFRNEGLDTTHNPEFTMCEFYSAYSNLSELISITEDLIMRLFRNADRLVQSQLWSLDRERILLPEGPWKQVEFVPALENALGFQVPDLSDPDALSKLSTLVSERTKLTVLPELTLSKLLDQLAGEYLEVSSLEQPLFIIHHPACMSPLSKSFTCPKTSQLVSARAELFIGGREIANMYEEENDPFEQRRKFELQLQSRGSNAANDDEGPAEVDESYIQALEHGLPPTGGWGCGVDRLVMLLSGAPRISDTLSFGNLRNVVSLSQAVKNT